MGETKNLKKSMPRSRCLHDKEIRFFVNAFSFNNNPIVLNIIQIVYKQLHEVSYMILFVWITQLIVIPPTVYAQSILLTVIIAVLALSCYILLDNKYGR